MLSRFMIGLSALAFASGAQAAVAVLDDIVPVGSEFEFDYRITLGPDEGLRAGDKLVIFDFLGYVDGSIFATGDVTSSVEFLSLPFITPGETDDPGIVNLVFTYTGPDLRTADGPFDSLVSNGFGARSIFSRTVLDAFTSVTTKNNPDIAEGTTLIQGGLTQVPAIPEPATWAMMIAGFGMVGATVRRRRSVLAHSTC
jgi:hypothetical protein